MPGKLDTLRANFANDAAEKDSAALAKYFVPPASYLKAKLLGSSVIYGRLGSGKTALAKRLGSESKIPPEDRIEIYFTIDSLIAELSDAAGTKDYPTLARALVYLRFIYDYAEKMRGKLIPGSYAALTKELKALKLHPYRDLIGRIFDSATSFAGKIKSIDIADLFGFELHDPEAEGERTVKRYRELIARIDGLVRKLLAERPRLLVIDAVDPATSLLEETASLIGALVRWLSYPGITSANLSFLICIPYPVFRKLGKEGIHVPNQEIFVRLSWSADELQKIITERAVVASADPKKWLADELGIDLEKAIGYTFNRPRDCIKLVRCCADAKLADPKASADKIWAKGIAEYSQEVLEFMSTEWHLNADGWEDVKAVLAQLNAVVDEKALTDAIKEIRAAGHLNGRATAGIIAELKAFGLVSQTGKQYSVHPTLRT